MNETREFLNAKIRKSIEKHSSFCMTIENFSELQNAHVSKKIHFLDSDDVWWISIEKTTFMSAFQRSPKIQLTFFLQASDYILKSRIWLFSVSGTINGKELRSNKNFIYQKVSSYETYVDFDTLSNQRFLELKLKMTFSQTEATGKAPQKFINTIAQYKRIIANSKKLLIDATYSDFAFIVHGKTFKVHKNILAAASPVFNNLFGKKFRENVDNECDITDFEPMIFQCLLNFIYCGELPEQLDELSRKLFEAAHYYQITELEDVCESVQHYNLSKDNAVDIYEWASIYNLENLKVDAWKIIQFEILEIFEDMKPPPIQSVRSLMDKKMVKFGGVSAEDNDNEIIFCLH